MRLTHLLLLLPLALGACAPSAPRTATLQATRPGWSMVTSQQLPVSLELPDPVEESTEDISGQTLTTYAGRDGNYTFGLSVVMSVVCTVLPVLMTAEALRRVGPNLVALSGAIGPVAAAVFGYLVLAEPMGWLQLAGAALTVAGVMIISLWRTA